MDVGAPGGFLSETRKTCNWRFDTLDTPNFKRSSALLGLLGLVVARRGDGAHPRRWQTGASLIQWLEMNKQKTAIKKKEITGMGENNKDYYALRRPENKAWVPEFRLALATDRSLLHQRRAWQPPAAASCGFSEMSEWNTRAVNLPWDR